jgi:hypothetical protein
LTIQNVSIASAISRRITLAERARHSRRTAACISAAGERNRALSGNAASERKTLPGENFEIEGASWNFEYALSRPGPTTPVALGMNDRQ